MSRVFVCPVRRIDMQEVKSVSSIDEVEFAFFGIRPKYPSVVAALVGIELKVGSGFSSFKVAEGFDVSHEEKQGVFLLEFVVVCRAQFDACLVEDDNQAIFGVSIVFLHISIGIGLVAWDVGFDE